MTTNTLHQAHGDRKPTTVENIYRELQSKSK